MKKYTKIMAAVLAATMSASAFATAVPGLSSDIFEFSQPGGAGTDAADPGAMAITNISEIFTSVRATGGSDIDLDKFWSAFVASTQTNVFEYGKAKGMIEELIFTVEGTKFVGVGSSGADALGYRKMTGFDLDDMLAKGSNIKVVGSSADAADVTAGLAENIGDAVSAGLYVDGKLSTTKTAAIALLTSLGLTAAGDVIDQNAVDADNTLVTVSNSEVAALAAANGVNTVDAGIDKIGFDNANALIALISNQLKTGFILDTAAATLAVQAIADQHNGYLGARIVHDAKSIKNIIKAIGVQEAAVGVGKGAETACRSNGNSNESNACTSIGDQFKTLVLQLPVVGSDLAGEYTSILSSIDAIVTAVGTFNNGSINGYSATAADSAIKAQFGTITVVRDVDGEDNPTVGSLYENLLDNSITNPTLQAATDNTNVVIPGETGDFDFTGAVTINSEDLFSF